MTRDPRRGSLAGQFHWILHSFIHTCAYCNVHCFIFIMAMALTECVPFGQSWAASAPARVSDTFDNPINIYEALYWNNTELLYTHTCVGVCVCMWVWMQQKTSNKRNTRSIVSRRTCRKLHGIWRSCLHSSGCCCCCSHIAHTHHRSVPLWCFDAVSLVRPSQSESSSIAIFDFLIILKAMSALMLTPSEIALRVCVWVGVWVCVCV